MCTATVPQAAYFFLFATLLRVLLLPIFSFAANVHSISELAMFRVPAVAEIKKLRGAVPVRSRLRPKSLQIPARRFWRARSVVEDTLRVGVPPVSEQSSGR